MKLDLGWRIGELLYEHDCVIVPHFGGFVANEKEAQLNEQLGTISPPYKQVSYNQNLTHNDGLLANHLVVKEGMSYDDAVSFLLSEANRFKHDLKEGRRIELNGLGVLYRDKSGFIHFVPNREQNFLKSSFGLGKLYLTPVAAEAESPKEGVVIPMTPPHDGDTGDRKIAKPNRKKWLAAAVVLPLLFASGWIINAQMGESNLKLASLNPFHASPISSSYEARIEDENIKFDYEERLNLIQEMHRENEDLESVYFSFVDDELAPDGIKVRLKNTPEAVHLVTHAETARPMKMWFIVGGAFKEKSNADNWVSTLKSKGFDSYIFEKRNGLHLVCYGSFTSKSAAQSVLAEVKSTENPKAWIKKH